MSQTNDQGVFYVFYNSHFFLLHPNFDGTWQMQKSPKDAILHALWEAPPLLHSRNMKASITSHAHMQAWMELCKSARSYVTDNWNPGTEAQEGNVNKI